MRRPRVDELPGVVNLTGSGVDLTTGPPDGWPAIDGVGFGRAAAAGVWEGGASVAWPRGRSYVACVLPDPEVTPPRPPPCRPPRAAAHPRARLRPPEARRTLHLLIDFSPPPRLCVLFCWRARVARSPLAAACSRPSGEHRLARPAVGADQFGVMHRARAALQCARLAHGLGGFCRLVALQASLPPRARLSAPVPVPFALSAAALPHAWRGFASSGACRAIRKLRFPQP